MTVHPAPVHDADGRGRSIRDEASMLVLELLVAGFALAAAGLLSLAR